MAMKSLLTHFQMIQSRFEIVAFYLLEYLTHAASLNQDRQLLVGIFPSLASNLMPTAAAYGLEPLALPLTLKISYLHSMKLTEKAIPSLFFELTEDETSYLNISIDAEWNVSQKIGVSILQLAVHSDPNMILIIPVSGCHFCPWLTCAYPFERYTDLWHCHQLLSRYSCHLESSSLAQISRKT